MSWITDNKLFVSLISIIVIFNIVSHMLLSYQKILNTKTNGNIFIGDTIVNMKTENIDNSNPHLFTQFILLCLVYASQHNYVGKIAIWTIIILYMLFVISDIYIIYIIKSVTDNDAEVASINTIVKISTSKNI